MNNYLDQPIFAPGIDPFDLRPLSAILPPPLAALVPTAPVYLIVNNVGNPDLREESLTAFEVAYTGTFGPRTTFGVALYQKGSSVEELIKAADGALYKAKENGRNRVECT